MCPIIKAQFVDIICVNRYYGWYHNLGYLSAIKTNWINEISGWKRTFGKPILITEYGAEAIPGFNQAS